MCAHQRVSSGDMLGKHERHRRRSAGRLACAFQRQAHGVGVRHAALQRVHDGGLQRSGAVAIEQAGQHRRGRTQDLSTLGGEPQKLRAGGCRLRQAVACTVRPGSALELDQGFDMNGLLDLLTSIPAANVAHQLLRAVEDANPVFVGQYGQGSANVGVGTE